MVVEEHLNNVKYDFNNFVPSIESLKFVNFIKEVNDGAEENETPLIHLKIIDSIFSTKRNTAIMSFRGSAKSSLMEYLVLYVAAFGYIPKFGKTDLILYVSDSMENGAKNFRKNIEFRYENSEYLKKIIPNMRLKVSTATSTREMSGSQMDEEIKGGIKFTDAMLEFKNRSGHTTIVKLYGVLTGIRGTKSRGKRPQVAILDDLVQKDKDARSPTIMQNIKDTIYKDVMYALHPKRRKIIFVGTPFNQNDPLYEAIESGKWETSVFPICEKFPCSKKEFVGAWEDRFDYEYVKEQYELASGSKQPQSFFQELMLRIVSNDDRLVSDDQIIWYDHTDQIIAIKKNYNFFITTDFAVTQKSSADPTAMLIWAIDKDGFIYLVNGYMKRVTIDISIDYLFNFVKYYEPMFVGLERSGQQGAIITTIKQEMIRKNTYFALAREGGSKEEGLTSSVDKITRFNSVVPLFSTNRIRFPKNLKNEEWMKELMNQLTLITMNGIGSARDDMLDCVSQLGKIKLIRPTEEEPQEVKQIKLKQIYEPDIFDEYSYNYNNFNGYIN